MDSSQHTTSSFGPPNELFAFSSAASSLPCSTPSSLSDGKVSTTTDKFLAVTLLYSYKNGNHVLFLEVGKDFVDILLSFLTLPLGGIVKLLSSPSTDWPALGPNEAIFKMASSVEKMDDEKFCASKKSLLDPPEAIGFVSKLLEAHADREARRGGCVSSSHEGCVFYSCGMVPHCVYITKKSGRRCPRHGRKMQTLCKFVEGPWENPNRDEGRKLVEKGFVRDAGGKFFVTDNLGIYPGSKSLALLQKLKVERMALLSSLDLFIGMDEILKLLKTSMVSNTVLQDVFGRLVRERLPPPHDPPPTLKSTTFNSLSPTLVVSTTSKSSLSPPTSITKSSKSSSPTTTIIPKTFESSTAPSSAPISSKSSTVTSTSVPTTNNSSGFDELLLFLNDRNRPKYDDYFPRPKSIMFS